MAFAAVMHVPAEAQSAKAGAQQVTGTVESHIAAAKTAAGTQFTALQERVCEAALPVPPLPPAGRGGGGEDGRPVRHRRRSGTPEPAKVFDNLYFVGMTEHSAWALTTSQGIIVIDTIYDYSVEDEVVNGLKTLGLNPADISYALVSHAHTDHIGGAEVPSGSLRHARRHVEGGLGLRGPYGPRTDSSEARHRGEGRRQADARRYHHRHAPDAGSHAGHGVEHLRRQGSRHAAHGRDVGRNDDPGRETGNVSGVIASAERYKPIVKKSGADIILSNHTAYDNTNANIAALRARKPGEPHPYVVGNAGDPPLPHDRRGMRESRLPSRRARLQHRPAAKYDL